TLLKQRGTLRDERLAMFRPILVRGTNELDGRHDLTVTVLVEDENLVLGMLPDIHVDGLSRLRGCIRKSSHTTGFAGSHSPIFNYKNVSIEFVISSETDTRFGGIAFR